MTIETKEFRLDPKIMFSVAMQRTLKAILLPCLGFLGIVVVHLVAAVGRHESFHFWMAGIFAALLMVVVSLPWLILPKMLRKPHAGARAGAIHLILASEGVHEFAGDERIGTFRWEEMVFGGKREETAVFRDRTGEYVFVPDSAFADARDLDEFNAFVADRFGRKRSRHSAQGAGT